MTRNARSHDFVIPVRAQRMLAVTMTACALGMPALVDAQTAQPAPAKAAAQDMAAVESAFKRADANGDGKLNKAEAAAIPTVAAKFDELDKDRDGQLSLAEFAAGYTAA
jgi:Ca2+-binding EF-hand superfamily protein